MSFRDWYDGKHIPNDPNSPLVFAGGRHQRHWTAKVASVLVGFWLREWKWVIGTVLALIGIIIALKKI
jgi:hypothetical protein